LLCLFHIFYEAPHLVVKRPLCLDVAYFYDDIVALTEIRVAAVLVYVLLFAFLFRQIHVYFYALNVNER
jgi:hypothetical protein